MALKFGTRMLDIFMGEHGTLDVNCTFLTKNYSSLAAVVNDTLAQWHTLGPAFNGSPNDSDPISALWERLTSSGSSSSSSSDSEINLSDEMNFAINLLAVLITCALMLLGILLRLFAHNTLSSKSKSTTAAAETKPKKLKKHKVANTHTTTPGTFKVTREVKRKTQNDSIVRNKPSKSAIVETIITISPSNYVESAACASGDKKRELASISRFKSRSTLSQSSQV